MISIHFLDGVTGNEPPATVGPAPWFRLTASYLRKGPHGTIAGSFRGTLWEVDGRHYRSLECRAGVIACFEDAMGHTSGRLGPFPYLRVNQGHIEFDTGRLARFDERSRRWRDVSRKGVWPDVLIIPAEG